MTLPNTGLAVSGLPQAWHRHPDSFELTDLATFPPQIPSRELQALPLQRQNPSPFQRQTCTDEKTWLTDRTQLTDSESPLAVFLPGLIS